MAGVLVCMLAFWAPSRLSGQDIPPGNSSAHPADTVPLQDTVPPQDTVPLQETLRTPDSIPLKNPVPDTAARAEEPGAAGEKDEKLSSSKALLFSAIIPGGGQFYNRKYWKIPIVYGGFVALGISINFNQRYYSEFVRELNYRGDGDPLTVPKYDEEAIPSSRIIEARNYYRRYRDLCIIGVGVMYGLNIVDAYVDAELSNFDISEDLTMKLSPGLQQSPYPRGGMGVAPGLSLTFAIQ